MDAVKGLERNIVTFGLTSKADVYAKNVIRIGSLTKFDIMYKGKLCDTVNIHVPGVHNLKNALAQSCGLHLPRHKAYGNKIRSCRLFGAGRRFEFKGKFNGADVYDDYAHHPGELKALLWMLPKRLDISARSLFSSRTPIRALWRCSTILSVAALRRMCCTLRRYLPPVKRIFSASPRQTSRRKIEGRKIL